MTSSNYVENSKNDVGCILYSTFRRLHVDDSAYSTFSNDVENSIKSRRLHFVDYISYNARRLKYV